MNKQYNSVDKLLKVPPYSEHNEQAVLGCLIQQPKYFYQLSDLKAEHFYFEKHQIIFSAISEMSKDQKPIDMLTLSTYLENTKEIDKVGGIPYIAELSSHTPSASHYRSYADIVKDKYKRRMMIMVGDKIMGFGYDDTQEDVASTINTCKLMLEDSINSAVEDNLSGNQELIEEVFEHYTERKERKRKGVQLGLPTGFSCFNFEPKELITFSALSGVGKSILAVDVAINVSKWRQTLFFSFEMSTTEIMYRILSNVNRVPLSSITEAEASEEQVANYVQRFKTECPKLKIHDKTLTMEEIFMMVKKEKIINGVELVIIDYAQITGDEMDDVVKKTRYVTRKAKQIAQDTGVTVIILSQFNRDAEKGGFPKASQLLGGTSVRQDSNQIFILHNPTISDEENGASSIEPRYILRKCKDRNSSACKKDYYLERQQDYMSFKQINFAPEWSQQ